MSNVLPRSKQIAVLDALVEGVSVRGTKRLTGVCREAILRLQIRRFTRLTNAHSKKLENHGAAIALHFAHYNFARIHSTIRCTPAMAAGIATTVWSMDDLLDAALAHGAQS